MKRMLAVPILAAALFLPAPARAQVQSQGYSCPRASVDSGVLAAKLALLQAQAKLKADTEALDDDGCTKAGALPNSCQADQAAVNADQALVKASQTALHAAARAAFAAAQAQIPAAEAALDAAISTMPPGCQAHPDSASCKTSGAQVDQAAACADFARQDIQ